MQKRTREKIALVVFIALIIVAGIVVSTYLSTGRTWTRAATALDDTVGAMNGYTAVVFAGTNPKDITGEGEGEGGASTGSSESTDNAGDNAATSEAAGDDATLVDTMGLRILALYPGNLTPGFDGVFVSDVRDLYERKDAKAITLNLSDIAAYENGEILRAGSRTIGVFSIQNATSPSLMKAKIESLKARGADCIICIAPRPACISYYDGINGIIFTDPDANISKNNATKGTAIIKNPQIGEVGLLIFTKNNTASAKVISAL